MVAEAFDSLDMESVVAVVRQYADELLVDDELRNDCREQCEYRLTHQNQQQVQQYADQAILANLDWGIDALEDAIRTSNGEIKRARLDHAEKMIQVCALLDTRSRTAGIPNSYLASLAHLNLALVWRLKEDDHRTTKSMLQMFQIEPFYSRLDFAPSLWSHLFLPHLGGIQDWYKHRRQQIVGRKKTEKDEFIVSFSADFFVRTAAVECKSSTLNSVQQKQLEELEELYQDTLDEFTRQCARFYKDRLVASSGRGSSLMPIAEPPETPGPSYSSNSKQDHLVRAPFNVGIDHDQPSRKDFGDTFSSRSIRIDASSQNCAEECRLDNDQSKVLHPELEAFLEPIPEDASSDIDSREPTQERFLQPLYEESNLYIHSKKSLEVSFDRPVHEETASFTHSTKGAQEAFVISVDQRSGKYMDSARAAQKSSTQATVENSGICIDKERSSVSFDSTSVVPDTGRKSMSNRSLSFRREHQLDTSGQRYRHTDSFSNESSEDGSLIFVDPFASVDRSSDDLDLEKSAKSDDFHTNLGVLKLDSGMNDHSDEQRRTSATSSPAGATKKYSGLGASLVNFARRSPDILNNLVRLPKYSANTPRTANSPQTANNSPRNALMSNAANSPQTANNSPRTALMSNASDVEDSSRTLSMSNISDISELSDAKVRRAQNQPPSEPATTCTSFAAESDAEDCYDYDDSTIVHSSDNCSTLSAGPTYALWESASASARKSIEVQKAKMDRPVTLVATDSFSSVRPPKDFVCPITSQLFNDPVTLETGQTYERKAIQEWLARGNATCPITRQLLHKESLPSTNYVLKRLVDSWKEQYPEYTQEFCSSMESLNPLAHEEALPDTQSLKGANLSCQGSPSAVLSLISIENSWSNQLSHQPDSLALVLLPESQTKYCKDTTLAVVSNSPQRVFEDKSAQIEPLLTCLRTSDDLLTCESAIIDIAHMWQDGACNPKVIAQFLEVGVIDGFVDVLTHSTCLEVLQATLFLLSRIIQEDDRARLLVINADPAADCFVQLLKHGIHSGVIVLYQLNLPNSQLVDLNLLPQLSAVLRERDEQRNEWDGAYTMIMGPQSAAVKLLERVVTCGDQATTTKSTLALIHLATVPALISSLEDDEPDVRTSAVILLLWCMKAEGNCRQLICQTASLTCALQLLHSGDLKARTAIISFLSELLRFKRRASNEEILKTVQSEGLLSSMHVLLVHIQMAHVKHRPKAAGLLLQLDLLGAPVRWSIYREEAVEVLVKSLGQKETPFVQMQAANNLVSLGGRFSASGESLMERWLLTAAGIKKKCSAFVKTGETKLTEDVEYESEEEEEEEESTEEWDRRFASTILAYEDGAILKVLGRAMESIHSEIATPSSIFAAWVMHMLPSLPDTGLYTVASKYLLKHFVTMLESSLDLQPRVISTVAIHSFLSHPGGLKDLLGHAADIVGSLRQLKTTIWMANDILQAFIDNASTQSVELWLHAEQGQLDCKLNGEVRALAHTRRYLFSGHSDGFIKVWMTRKLLPQLVHESKGHLKAVTCLAVSHGMDRMYSGSLDKSIRIWRIGSTCIECLHSFELKDPVQGVVVNGPMACIIPQGTGIKVQCEESETKFLNCNKHVQSLAISDGKIYCGCNDYSIQEVEPSKGSVSSIQHSIKTLLGKRAIHAIQVFDNRLYAAGSPVEGTSCKVWELADFSLCGSFPTTSEVRCMAINTNFVYLGSNSGSIEVWLRDKYIKVSTIYLGSKVRVLMLQGETLYSGSEEGKIQMWQLL